MRISYWFLVAALSLALPAYAADRTEQIRFRYASAVEVERIFEPTSLAPPGTGGLGGVRALIPPGISAWTVDAQRNILSVTGEPEAIESLKNIVRLLDVPARQIRLEVRQLNLDDGVIRRLMARLRPLGGDAVVDGQPAEVAAMLEGEELREVETKGARPSINAVVSNNRPLRVRWAKEGNLPTVAMRVTPRLNGDSSVTLFMQSEAAPPAVQGDAPALVLAVRRLAVGQGAVFALRGTEALFLVTARGLQPQ